MVDKDTSLAEKIRTLFQEQGITIRTIRMAIGVLVEALLPGGGGAGTAGKPLPKDEKDLKDCIRNKLKTLLLLPRRLGVKAVEALSGIIGVILSWSCSITKSCLFLLASVLSLDSLKNK